MLEEEESSLAISADINMTPMIDVLLCLLIIFLVASPPPPSEQQPIAIPDDPITEQPDDPEATLLITVEDDGSARLGQTKLPASHDEIVEAIRNNKKAQ
ncbi:MAG: ExbD/TolR family protein, partial [Nannocystaceae bacterium]